MSCDPFTSAMICRNRSRSRAIYGNGKQAKVFEFPSFTRVSRNEHRRRVIAPAEPVFRYRSSHRSPSGYSGFHNRDSCASRECAVLGRFVGRSAAAATTPTALQSLRWFWGDRSGGFWGERQRESPRYYPRQRERVREPEEKNRQITRALRLRRRARMPRSKLW